MKKLTLMMSLLCLLLLAACGTESSNEGDTNATPSNGETTSNNEDTSTSDEKDTDSEANTNGEENTDTNTNTDATKETDTNTNADEADQDTDTTEQNTENNEVSTSETEKQLSYQLNGEIIEENATLTTSDNQGYTMYVLPEFTLTGEEPRKDTLYVTDSDDIFMRIELLSDDVNWETYEQNIPLELEYYGTDLVEPTDDILQIDQADIYEATNGVETATIYLIKDENQPMKLTMFTTVENDYRSAFVAMAKTLVKNQ